VKNLLLLSVCKDTEPEQKMFQKPRTKHSPAFEAKVVLVVLAGDTALA
jgi:hypothetical protein